MSMDTWVRARKLLGFIGEIDDAFLEEAESADVALKMITHRRAVGYGSLAVAASVGIALTIWLLKSKKRNAAAS